MNNITETFKTTGIIENYLYDENPDAYYCDITVPMNGSALKEKRCMIMAIDAQDYMSSTLRNIFDTRKIDSQTGKNNLEPCKPLIVNIEWQYKFENSSNNGYLIVNHIALEHGPDIHVCNTEKYTGFVTSFNRYNNSDEIILTLNSTDKVFHTNMNALDNISLTKPVSIILETYAAPNETRTACKIENI